MAGISTQLQSAVLSIIFGGTTSPITSIATTTTTQIWVALHTADPGNGGNQGTSEVAYTNYQRIATQRSTNVVGWQISGASPTSVFPSSAITFAQCTTASAVVVTNWSVGTTSSTGSGATLNMYFTGTVTPNISLGANVTPSLTTGSACTMD